MSGLRPARGRMASACAAFAVLVAAGAVASSGCSGAAGPGFGLTFQDNNPELLQSALQRYSAPAKAAPKNALGKPLAFLATRGSKKKNVAQELIAFDLVAKKELWRVTTAVNSRVVVGGDFIAHQAEPGQLVARAVSSGQILWQIEVDGFLSAAADPTRVYYVRRDDSGEKRRWLLVAASGATGAPLWTVSVDLS
ncbi:MAG: PQQ-binding-like beta-propeller repeat protein [Myxococcota bacterium]